MKIAMAPMEGVVDFVVRKMYSEIGGFDHFVTEFIRVTQQLLPPKVFYKYCPELKTNSRTHTGTPVYVQLLGSDPNLVAENAAVAIQLGAYGIDLNFGCPAKTVNRHDGGSTLLKDPQRVFNVIHAVRKIVPTDRPVSAKVRLGFESQVLSKEIGLAVQDANATHITIHARTKVDGYRPPAYWETIGTMRSFLQIPIYANGEIWTVDDYYRCRELSGCENVALGRGAMANPQLALLIKAHLTNSQESVDRFSWEDFRFRLIPQFINENINFREAAYALARVKQWTKYLSRHSTQAAACFDVVKRFHNIQEVQNYLRDENSATRSFSNSSFQRQKSASQESVFAE